MSETQHEQSIKADLPSYHKKFMVEVEAWVDHRSSSSIRHIFDPLDKEWKVCIRHSGGQLEQKWFDTFEEGVAWCEQYRTP